MAEPALVLSMECTDCVLVASSNTFGYASGTGKRISNKRKARPVAADPGQRKCCYRLPVGAGSIGDSNESTVGDQAYRIEDA